MISVYFANQSSNVNLYCFGYEKQNPNIKTITTNAALSALVTGTQLSGTLNNVDTRWFYTRCALAMNSNQSFYLLGSTSGTTLYKTGTINYQNLWSTIPTNVFLRTVYRQGETVSLYVNNANKLGVPFYMKNLYVINFGSVIEEIPGWVMQLVFKNFLHRSIKRRAK